MKKLAIIATTSLSIILMGCFAVSNAALTELVTGSKSNCPIKAGKYSVKSGTIESTTEIAIIQVASETLSDGNGTKCTANILENFGDSSRAEAVEVVKGYIEGFFSRRFMDLKNGVNVAYTYPITESPNVYYIGKNGKAYEIYARCSLVDKTKPCTAMSDAQMIKNRSNYLASTETLKAKRIAAETKKNSDKTYIADLSDYIQTPSYVLVPK